MKNNILKLFHDIEIDDLNEVGGKAHSLSKLTKLGYSVPIGFVITNKFFHNFFTTNNIFDKISSSINSLKNRPDNIDIVSSQISKIINKYPIHPTMINEINTMAQSLGGVSYAVRSSSASEDGKEYSWAGQMTSIMGVTSCNMENAIKTCLSSFFSPQALSYRILNSLSLEIGNNAVIIQKMIKSDYSGVAFSIDPRFNNSKHIVIETVSGLGEAIVSGKVMPIRYIFDKESFELIEYTHNTQKSIYKLDCTGQAKWTEGEDLNDNNIDIALLKELLEKITSLEIHWGCHVDIEWAIENDTLHILQCRPITNQIN